MTAAPPPRVLLLNASLEPLCVVATHRAVALVLSGKASILETDGRMLRSERLSVPLPLVLALTRYVRVPHRAVVPPTRRGVLHRDGHRCAYCSGPAETVDHVLPRSRGGLHEWTNVVAACGRCNHRKADRLLSELGWTLSLRPAAPRRAEVMLAGLAAAEPVWRAYLLT